MAAEGTESNGATEAAPLLDAGGVAENLADGNGVAARKTWGGDADLEVVGDPDREAEVANGRDEGADLPSDLESNGCDLEVSRAADEERGAREVGGVVAVQEEVEINVELKGGGVGVGEFPEREQDQHVVSRDPDVAVVHGDGGGDILNVSENCAVAADDSAEHPEKSVGLTLEESQNGVLQENGNVDVVGDVEIKGGELADFSNGVDETAGPCLKPITNLVLTEPERTEGEDLSEEVCRDVQIIVEEHVQDNGISVPLRLESSLGEGGEGASSMQASVVGLHDQCGSHTENMNALSVYIGAMLILPSQGEEIEAKGRNVSQEMVCDNKETNVHATCLKRVNVDSTDHENEDSITCRPLDVIIEDIEGQVPLEEHSIEVNGHSIGVPKFEANEEKTDCVFETREEDETCTPCNIEQQSKPESNPIQLRESAPTSEVKAENLESEIRENVEKADEHDLSLSAETETRYGMNADVAPCSDNNVEQKLEDSNDADVHVQVCCATLCDGCPIENGRVRGTAILVTSAEEDCLPKTATIEIHSEKEEPTLNTNTIEIAEVSPPAVEVGDDVQREINVDEGNMLASDIQEKISSADDDEKHVTTEDGGKDGMHGNGIAAPSTVEATAGLGVGSRFFMIRIPRLQDEKLVAQIQHAEACLEERTQKRDSINMKIQEKQASLDEYKVNINEARNEERAAREAIFSKQQEVNAIHSTADKIELANFIDNVDERVQYFSHRMQHETISLKEEKQLMREIKELKQKRDYLSKLTSQSEMQKAFDQKDQIGDSLKRLRPELDHLRKELSQVEMKTKASRKTLDDENQIMSDLRMQRKEANDLRQEAYMGMINLKNQLNEKNKHFYGYKRDARVAATYVSSGNKEALQKHCNDQIERFMELWNNKDEFRNQYVLANQNSTIRRFRTLDGRSLGPDEQPADLPRFIERKVESRAIAPSTSDVMQPVERKHDKTGKLSEVETVSETPDHVENGKNADRPKNLYRVDSLSTVTVVSNETTKAEEEERERKRAEDAEQKRLADELAREEELRKEQAAAELKEKIRLEQTAKAREADERKKRKAEKAKVAAEIRARKEAELKEKKRAKKEKLKEKKAASTAEVVADSRTPVDSVPDPLPEDVEESEPSVSPVSKKQPRGVPHVSKQHYNKIKPLPAPLRNKNKRKMQMWIWTALFVALVCILLLVGIYALPSRKSPLQFEF